MLQLRKSLKQNKKKKRQSCVGCNRRFKLQCFEEVEEEEEKEAASGVEEILQKTVICF